MERFVSDPLAVPPAELGYEWSSAELLVYGVDHSGPSYEVRVFVDAPDADVETPLTVEDGYAGCFTVFGHGGCFGDEDHCNPAARYTDEFDVRLPHQSETQTKVVSVTEALRARRLGRRVGDARRRRADGRRARVPATRSGPTRSAS